MRFTGCLLLVALIAHLAPAEATLSPPKSFATTAGVRDDVALPSQANLEHAMTSRGGEMSVQDKAVAGAAAFLVMDTAFRKIFRANNIKFPAQLGGCIILFTFLLLAEILVPGMGDGVFNALTPGAALLTKWLPVFFVPGLAMLPLAPSIGSAVDVSNLKLTTVWYENIFSHSIFRSTFLSLLSLYLDSTTHQAQWPFLF